MLWPKNTRRLLAYEDELAGVEEFIARESGLFEAGVWEELSDAVSIWGGLVHFGRLGRALG